MYLYNPVTYLAGGNQNILRLLTLFYHAKSDSANMHKACGLKVTQKNVVILGRLHNIFGFLIQTGKLQHLFTFLRLPMPNRTSIHLILLLSVLRLRIRSFGRHVVIKLACSIWCARTLIGALYLAMVTIYA